MDLELATLRDILEELDHRGAHFVFVGFQPTNAMSGEVHCAYQASSRREIRRIIQLLQQRLPTKDGPSWPD